MHRKTFLAFAAAFSFLGTALAADQGVTDREIRIGASAVLSGPLGPQTRDYGVGSRLYFDHVNAAGGVHGRRIRYTTLDDGFDVQQAVENTRKLIEEEKVFLIYNNTGTGHTAAILPLVEETQTVVFGPVTGASAFRDRHNRLLFHVRASYANEAQRIVGHLKSTGIQRVVAFYQDDVFGNTLLAEIRKAAEQEKLVLAREVKVDPKQPHFPAAARETVWAQPQAVIMATAGTTFPHFVKALRDAGARPGIYGFSVASLDVIHKELGSAAQGVVLAQIMPSMKNRSIPVVAEYLKLLKEKDAAATPSASQFEGFVHARLLVEGLRRAGPKPTTQSFIAGLESAGEISFGKFAARYSPQSHNGSAYVELGIVDSAGQLRY